ncbi:MAG: hypothetical protein LBM38_01290 [Clostridiales bacterium]|jgi:hypothetical protein|nr:hypothetical protein [Clostridiales bacterium]
MENNSEQEFMTTQNSDILRLVNYSIEQTSVPSPLSKHILQLAAVSAFVIVASAKSDFKSFLANAAAAGAGYTFAQMDRSVFDRMALEDFITMAENTPRNNVKVTSGIISKVERHGMYYIEAYALDNLKNLPRAKDGEYNKLVKAAKKRVKIALSVRQKLNSDTQKKSPKNVTYLGGGKIIK